jgi:hypothetical protein
MLHVTFMGIIELKTFTNKKKTFLLEWKYFRPNWIFCQIKNFLVKLETFMSDWKLSHRTENFIHLIENFHYLLENAVIDVVLDSSTLRFFDSSILRSRAVKLLVHLH